MGNQEEKSKPIHLAHSLTGNTIGSNSIQTMMDIVAIFLKEY